MSSHTISVGIFSKNYPTSRTIRDSIKNLGHRAELIGPYDYSINIRNNECKIKNDVDIIFNWHSIGYKQESLRTLTEISSYNEFVPVINKPESHFIANDKISSYIRIANSDIDISIPDTVFSSEMEFLYDESKSRNEVVQKPLFGGGGSGIEKIEKDEQATLLKGPQVGFIQEYIDTDSEKQQDYRVFIVGGESIATMKRTASGNEWITNISNNGNGSEGHIPNEVLKEAEKIPQKLGLDVTGIDLMKSKNNEWYFLEANCPAGFKGLHDSTGVNPAPYIAKLIIEEAGGSVQKENVSDLSKSQPITKKDNISTVNCHEFNDTDECIIGGYKSKENVQIKVDLNLDDPVFDCSVADKIGPIKMTGMTEHPLKDTEEMIPECQVRILLDNKTYVYSTPIADLSDYDADLLINSHFICEENSASSAEGA